MAEGDRFDYGDLEHITIFDGQVTTGGDFGGWSPLLGKYQIVGFTVWFATAGAASAVSVSKFQEEVEVESGVMKNADIRDAKDNNALGVDCQVGTADAANTFDWGYDVQGNARGHGRHRRVRVQMSATTGTATRAVLQLKVKRVE